MFWYCPSGWRVHSFSHLSSPGYTCPIGAVICSSLPGVHIIIIINNNNWRLKYQCQPSHDVSKFGFLGTKREIIRKTCRQKWPLSRSVLSAVVADSFPVDCGFWMFVLYNYVHAPLCVPVSTVCASTCMRVNTLVYISVCVVCVTAFFNGCVCPSDQCRQQ